MIFELHFDRQFSDAVIVDGLARAFSVPSETIRLVPSIPSEEDTSGVSLVCTKVISGGEFPLHVSIYPRSGCITLPTEVEAAQSLTRTLGCRCLISDDQVNPFSWLLVEGLEVRAVTVDSDALDRDELILDRESEP